ncbi:MAG: RAMP superfamily protein [Candidatus Schekmanbacteria bacterium]|nr:RAMP superfamily protein [Candidatus Schekmanbacteria bacterium]
MTSGRPPSLLQIELLSDATFSRGEGTAGVVDTEVERDKFGMPFIGGKTVRGLLRDSWLSMSRHFPSLEQAAERVLGRSQALDESCRLRISDAVLPAAIRATVRGAAERGEHKLLPGIILDGFTSIRYQTAEDRETGAPGVTTLRSSRVVLRGFVFEASLSWLDGYRPTAADARLLALCALATRHGGLFRNRGRGHIRMTLDGDIEATRKYGEATA